MPQVSFRFYAELNDHLPTKLRHVRFDRTVSEGSTVRDAFALLGIPAGEIDLVLVNGKSERLDYSLRDGDRVSAYPVFDSMDVGSLTKVEQRPPRRMRFVLDVHLGKLAHHLRMLGFDTLYRNDYTPPALIGIAAEEDRILLSKSRTLVDSGALLAAYCVQSSDPREQVVEVLHRFDLWSSAHPFMRCLHCNSTLSTVPKEGITESLPEKVRGLYTDFRACPSCGRIYWQGTHFQKMMAFTQRLYAAAGEPLPPGG
jgi:uncharacterized protein with PIN domain